MERRGSESSSFSTFGALLRHLRKRARLTQRELGIAVGYSETQITRLEGNTRQPDPGTVQALFIDALDLRNDPEEAQRLIALAESARSKSEGEAAIPFNDLSRPYPTNLPAQLTRFIGREDELAEVSRLLGMRRLVTLTGAGGVGKSRLALEVGARCRPQSEVDPAGNALPLPAFVDGVWLAELAPVTEPALVANQVATTFGLPLVNRPALKVLINHLHNRDVLLVLDNCEHLIGACAELAEVLLRDCLRLHILATSREPLNAAGEVTWRVPPLQVDEAIQLFVDRAQFANPAFTLTEQNSHTVAQVCKRLDGIPLAIELAAVRVRALSVEAIASRLNERFQFLTGGSHTAPPRHQTLRGLIDWSYDLLPEPERALLRGLSVFTGGWTLGAAEYVCAVDIDADILPHLVLLVDKSLVVADEHGAETRYRLHETIRAYAQERLADSGTASVMGHRHAEFYLALAEQAEPHLTTTEQGAWLDRLEAEHDNLRAALEWCQSQGDVQQGTVQIGLRLAGALWRFWFLRGHFDEGRHWMDAALTGTEGAPVLRAKVLAGAGLQADFTGDYARGATLCEASLALAREAGDDSLAALSLAVLGDYHSFKRSAIAKAVRLYEESLALARAAQDTWLTAFALVELGEANRSQYHLGQAVARLKEGLALARANGDHWLIALALYRLGCAVTDQGDYATARAYHEEGLAIRRNMRDQLGIAYALLGLAGTAEAQGDYAVAYASLQERLGMERELGNQKGVGYSLNALGLLALRLGEYDQAQAHFEESAAHFRALRDPEDVGFQLMCLGIIALLRRDYSLAQVLLEESLSLGLGNWPHAVTSALEALGRVATAQGHPAQAARLLGAVEATGEVNPELIPYSVIRRTDPAGYDRVCAVLRSELGTDAFTRAWAKGKAMTLEQAVAYVLQGSAGGV